MRAKGRCGRTSRPRPRGNRCRPTAAPDPPLRPGRAAAPSRWRSPGRSASRLRHRTTGAAGPAMRRPLDADIDPAAIARPMPDSAHVPEATHVAAAAGEPPYRVLIVEDDRAQALFAEGVLNGAGIEALVASEPNDVLETMARFRPDLVLMDLHMPGLSGTELTMLIRKHEAFLHTPIVFLTGDPDPEKQFEVLESGADDFLSKPIRPRHLVAAVESRVKRARSAGPAARGRRQPPPAHRADDPRPPAATARQRIAEQAARRRAVRGDRGRRQPARALRLCRARTADDRGRAGAGRAGRQQLRRRGSTTTHSWCSRPRPARTGSRTWPAACATASAGTCSRSRATPKA
jgi:DNA-binding response OmpR family regulator